ncbi:aquaporin [Cucurbitaria berberidis CBS 394.84]|uniref:Aquaporin n=1 Tax=Cucurbitaria berberidis CBS 394.84 TaxID=1168544 RepID=A0A9P4G9C8_9PLEO|nr:aquaporin [Cucurbitaria berberidis CBS 394.84]KAF1841548.1 aquaporin [Cucurbitaria berberidis CBS 394.84]
MVLPGMKPKYTEDPKRPSETRLPGFGWLPNRIRHLFIACLGEFVGTFLFLFFAFAATQVANNLLNGKRMDIESLMYISLAFGFSLAVNVWIFFRISGGLFNPAVTIAMGLIGAVPWLNAAVLVVSQILAGIAAAGMVSALFPGPLSVRTTLSRETSVVRGLFIEMFLTAQLVFCIFMLAAEKHRSTFIAPIGIGLALFVAEMAGVYFTGGSLNPARSFGPAVVLRSFPSYHWIYWLGPLLGAIVAVFFYRLIKALEYETANPGAEGNGHEAYHMNSKGQAVHDDGRPSTRHGTDGANEHDFASQLQSGKRQPSRIQRQVKPSSNTATMEHIEKPTHPEAVFAQGMDGHRSDNAVNHPDDRPRAQHKRASSNYEIASDRSYRSGPDAESGSSMS